MTVLTIWICLIAGCDDDAAQRVGLLGRDAPSVEFRYGDSSVPPQYHRSYTLEVTPDEIHATIDSYGDVLLDQTVPLDDATWNDFVTKLERRTHASDEETGDDCTGGTSRDLTVRSGDTVVDATSFSVCGVDGNQAAAEELDALMAPLTARVPGWDEAMS